MDVECKNVQQKYSINQGKNSRRHTGSSLLGLYTNKFEKSVNDTQQSEILQTSNIFRIPFSLKCCRMQHNMLTGLVSKHLHLNTQEVRSVEPHLSSFIIIIIIFSPPAQSL